MIVTVEVTKQDYKKFLGYYILHSKIMRLCGAIAFIMILIVQLIISNMDLKFMSIFLLLDVALFGFIFWQMVSSNSSKVLEPDSRLGYKEINITSKILEVRQDRITKEIQSGQMRYFNEDRNSFYIYSTYIDVIILPKRFFESEEKQKDFRELVKQMYIN